jgi:hypothetical protein
LQGTRSNRYADLRSAALNLSSSFIQTWTITAGALLQANRKNSR